jgi:hypothetical protein
VINKIGCILPAQGQTMQNSTLLHSRSNTYQPSGMYFVANLGSLTSQYITIYFIIIIIIIIIGIQPLGHSGQRPEFSQVTGMSLVRCIMGKFLGVACHCFPPHYFLYTNKFHRK